MDPTCSTPRLMWEYLPMLQNINRSLDSTTVSQALNFFRVYKCLCLSYDGLYGILLEFVVHKIEVVERPKFVKQHCTSEHQCKLTSGSMDLDKM
jgi:hypothetical protein